MVFDDVRDLGGEKTSCSVQHCKRLEPGERCATRAEDECGLFWLDGWRLEMVDDGIEEVFG